MQRIIKISLFITLLLTPIIVAQPVEPGSVVLFGQYISSPTDAVCNDTLFTLTNRHPTRKVFVRVLFINRADRSAEEYAVCLPAGQTVRWRASEMDPGVAGCAFAVATDAAGRPLNFNWLTGASSIINHSRREAWQQAISLPKLTTGGEIPVNGFSTASFDGEMYARLPAQLAALLPAAALRIAADPIACSSTFSYRSSAAARD